MWVWNSPIADSSEEYWTIYENKIQQLIFKFKKIILIVKAFSIYFIYYEITVFLVMANTCASSRGNTWVTSIICIH